MKITLRKMNCKKNTKSWLTSFLLLLSVYIQAQSSGEYDIVLTGGRVIDPETKLDAIKNVGIIDHHIAQISSEP